MNKLTDIDKIGLELSIEKSKEAFKLNNFPIGAALIIENIVIGAESNNINTSKSFVKHAETNLIIKYQEEIYKAKEQKLNITLYTTLEPCLQCLGMAVLNGISKIVYIVQDPQGGATKIENNKLGIFYKKNWPDILWAPVSEEPLKMMLKYFEHNVNKGNKEWGQHMLNLFQNIKNHANTNIK